jgi:hypothetical protein
MVGLFFGGDGIVASVVARKDGFDKGDHAPVRLFV